MAQTYSDFKILVADDGTSDNTSEIVKRYSLVGYVYQENATRTAPSAKWPVGWKCNPQKT
jgi:glycosyltransferase involved in cell wall biosynthesis